MKVRLMRDRAGALRLFEASLLAILFTIPTPDAIAASAAEQVVTAELTHVEDSNGSSPLSAEGRLKVVEGAVETERAPRAAAAAGNAAQQPPAQPPQREGTFRTQKFLEGIQLDLDFNYRFMANVWRGIQTLGRTDVTSATEALPPANQLRDYTDVSFFRHRSTAALRVIRPQVWNANLEMDLFGSDFNDGAIMGNEPAGILGSAGVRRASIDVRRVWLEYSGYQRTRIQVGRFGTRIGNGMLSNVNRDGVRAFINAGRGLQLVPTWVRGSQGSTVGESGIPNVDDKGGVQVVVNPVGGRNDALSTFVLLANYQPPMMMAHRFQLALAKQVDGTFNERQPEKLFVDLNGSGTFRRQFTYSWETAYMGSHSARSSVVGRRLRNQGFLLYGTGSYKLPENTLGGRLTVGATAGFGTGDSNPSDGRQKGMQSLFMDEAGYEYTVIYSDDIHGFNGSAASVGNMQGFANTKFLQPSLQVQVHRDVSARVTYTFLRAHKAQLEGTGPLGNGVFGVDPFLTFPATSTARTKEIGHEVDLHLNYVVDKNITLFTRAGWFDPGAIFGSGTRNVFKLESGLEFRF